MDDLHAWCLEERASMQEELDFLSRQFEGGGLHDYGAMLWKDWARDRMDLLKRRLPELEKILARGTDNGQAENPG